jgi:chromosome segregation ATPase
MQKAEEYKAKAASLSESHEALRLRLKELAEHLSSLRQEEASKNAEREATNESMEELLRLSEDFAREKEGKNDAIRSIAARNDEISKEISEKEQTVVKIRPPRKPSGISFH